MAAAAAGVILKRHSKASLAAKLEAIGLPYAPIAALGSA